ncbi:Tex family protein [Niabella terrae]
MDSKYLQQIAQDLTLPAKQIGNVAQLHTEGATIPFISRYRKEATGNMDEVQVANVIDKIQYYEELEKRKETVLKTIDAAGKLSPELRQKIEQCIQSTELEDIYLPYKPKRKTRATTAIENGLEPLATFLLAQQYADPETEAAKFVSENVPDSQTALQGARDIIAERIAEDQLARTLVRNLFSEQARLSARVLTTKKETEEAQKYRDYFEYGEALSAAPSHRLLAIRRGEKEGFLIMDIAIDKELAIEGLKKIFIINSGAAADQVALATEDAYNRLLKPSIETEFRMSSKAAADEEAIRVFAENLRQLLLASPLGHKKILAIDPGFRTGCKVVCLDASGAFLKYETIFPHPPQQEKDRAVATLKNLVARYDIEAIGYGNGTASKETEALVRGIDFGKPVSVFMVNESGASIYSASEVAREEFPDQDLTVRGAISIGRRLLDPLSELVKIDAKSIGVGQYQHDVNQHRLKESLDKVVESCVNFVGVDVNTASKHLLSYVSGLTATTAKNIVDHRNLHGPFSSRKELLKVSMLGPKAFEQAAGFLRIPNAADPLDNSGVHPESYSIVAQMAGKMNCAVTDLIRDPALRRQIRAGDFITEQAGTYTIEDILKELEKPGRDPRPPIEVFRFDETLSTIADLKPGMKVPGIVTNITNFGAFVDVGVKQDGLVHVSHLANKFVSDPAEVVKLNQKVMVTVLEVDTTRKRIALSMKDENQPRQGSGRPASRSQPIEKPSKSNFHNSLDALRKKFAD